jgi:hypothetical protein
MISEEASISNETKPSAQIARGISRSRETRTFILSFCTKTAYRRRDTKPTTTISVVGTTQTWRDVRLESVVRTRADIYAAAIVSHLAWAYGAACGCLS